MADATRTQKLQDGQTAPHVKVTDVLGKSFDSKKSKQRFILLAFMRYSGCPWCNLAIHRLAMEYPTFLENDCEVVAFMQSESDSIVENIHNRHAVVPKFPIVADQKRHFYDKYGVLDRPAAITRSITKIPAWVEAVRTHGFKQSNLDGDLFLVPAYFLIDTRDNTIAAADYGKSFYDHDTFVNLYEHIFFRAY
jgi:peroxiredoxin